MFKLIVITVFVLLLSVVNANVASSIFKFVNDYGKNGIIITIILIIIY